MTQTQPLSPNLSALRDAIFADPALVDRLSAIKEKDALASELLGVAAAKGISVDAAALGDSLEAELAKLADAELSDDELEAVAAGFINYNKVLKDPKNAKGFF
ncbi:hypothetical protein GE253_14325 [Niveispirillum sp. SYP-B3756]|uniref:hypothetical protein n=1 Tax=Niveispirillum sp. SYP-B3756 TaxID=2662178 RepID=UPI001291DA18|nr:hypothetical protein [Niveispirillum sp. SYP-B3756]MQP66508.1 hypothetical protein [Niveispirillum sp. SYP-B3756]